MGKTKKSSAASGLAISKSGSTFSCSWKIPKDGYGDGQQFWCNTAGNLSVGKTATSKAFSVNFGLYYPYSGSYLTYVQFAVRGNRDKKKGDKWTWSDWNYGTYYMAAPPVPSLTAERQAARTTKFSWSVSPAENQPFADIVVQTVLTANGAAPNWNAASTWTTGTSGSWATPEPGYVDTQGTSYTRWFRVCSRGAAGASAWAYASHTYAHPKQAEVKSYTVKENNANGYDVRIEWEALVNGAWPIDSTVVEYCIAEPGTDASYSSGSWTAVNTSHATGGREAAFFTVDGRCGPDQCLFVRVNTKHDDNTTQGVPTRVFEGKLKAPTLGQITTDPTTYTATVAATNASNIADAFLLIYFKSGSEADNPLAVGMIPHGSSNPATVHCPNWSNDEEGEMFFGVRAVVGTPTVWTRTDGVTVYEITPKMASDISWSDGVNVLQVTGLTLKRTAVEGSIRASWNWTWASANSAEISWADHPDAWESTAAPSTFMISNRRASAWNIADLALGKPWYVRVRLLREDGDKKIYTPYSDIAEIDLSSAPDRPMLDLSETVVTQGQDFTASWDYISTDGTLQESAELALVDISQSPAEYIGIGQYKAEQHADLNANIFDSMGAKYLAVRVKSESGLISPWSDTVAITVAEPLVAEIASTSLQTIEVVSDEEEGTTRSQLSLTEMPLTVTVNGAGVGGTTTVTIKRAEEFHVDRPDENTFDGYKGESIAVKDRIGGGSIVFHKEELIGSFDDGAQYTLTAVVRDSLGQTDEQSLDFEVHWAHQACEITAAVFINHDDQIAVIDVPAPAGAAETDTFDLYRLSADKPELILRGGIFGTKYVDPYPAIGNLGGHRIVSRTANGDYITSSNVVEFFDTSEDEGDILHSKHVIIDFGGDKVELKYDIDISSKWSKDFKETKYLGGAVQGDWNPAVSRSGSVSVTVVPEYEEDTVEAMRRLSVYTGICHVRTPDGSSYPADVQVSESWNSDKAGKAAEFSLNITRVDPEGMDGMTLMEWIDGGES